MLKRQNPALRGFVFYIPKQPEDAGFSELDWRCDRGVPL
ncbi:hypothetical protein D515_02445 [Grimontia indica]|uniref:Uncharacterized protein n=1 Tax=Grimontia indica TaxID=1056512 RepID=R1GRX2_9GAMM|nr:hypothetical protein D515_02445 [Grimontia indica]